MLVTCYRTVTATESLAGLNLQGLENVTQCVNIYISNEGIICQRFGGEGAGIRDGSDEMPDSWCLRVTI